MNTQEIKKLETKILLTLKNHLKPGDIVIAGISGGPDSVFLLHFLKKLPIKVIVAHVNHKLRKEADKDEEFVCKLCTTSATCHDNCITDPPKSSTTTFAHITTDIKSLSQKYKHGLEETGRKVRYDFFKKLAKKHHAKFILTAHHADDNLETIILNFARGASLQGLAGMQEVEQLQHHPSLFRPLLGISKQEIFDFLHSHKLSFCVDKSNNSLLYKRNFIRHKIVPLLKEINPSITATLAKNTSNISEINEYLKAQAQDWLKKHLIIGSQFSGAAFRALPLALQKIILLQIYEHHIGNTQNLKSINLTEILKMIEKNIGNKKKKLGSLTISIKNNIVTIASHKTVFALQKHHH